MDRRFPPPGVKLVASNDRNWKVIVKLRRPIAQTSPVFPPLSEGGALVVVVVSFHENRYRTRVFPRPHHLGRRGCAGRLPLPAGGDGGAQKGRKWRERPPFYPSWCGTGRGARSLHSDPCGKAVESPRKPTAEKQQTTNGPQAETGTPGGVHTTQYLRSAPGQLATPLDGLGLWVDSRLTCPPTSWSVQWIPFQKEGYNEGTATG